MHALNRQRERKRAAFADLAFHPTATTVMLDDFFANRQAQTRTLAQPTQS